MKSDLERSLNELRLMIAESKLTPAECDELHESLDELTKSLDEESIDSSMMASAIYERVMDFQQTHPMLTRTMNQVADILSQMGI